MLFGRFIPLLRSFVSFAAGLGEMALPKFAIFTVIGCAVWCTALCSLGYSLGAATTTCSRRSASPGTSSARSP